MNILDGKCDLSPKFFFIVLNLQHKAQLLYTIQHCKRRSPAVVEKCAMLPISQNCKSANMCKSYEVQLSTSVITQKLPSFPLHTQAIDNQQCTSINVITLPYRGLDACNEAGTQQRPQHEHNAWPWKTSRLTEPLGSFGKLQQEETIKLTAVSNHGCI